MEQTYNLDEAKPLKLSAEEERLLVQYVQTTWKKGKDARKQYEEHWKACDKAYNCVIDPLGSDELDEWMSRKCLPWAYDSAESWYAHIHSTTCPRDDRMFTLNPITEDDLPGAETMEKYMEWKLQRMDFPGKYGKALKQLIRKNHTVIKVYWRKEERISYDARQQGEMTLYTQVPQPVYDGPWLDIIPIENFVFYPIHGDIEQTTRIHETYKHLDWLKTNAQAANYFNLDKLTEDDEKEQTFTDTPDVFEGEAERQYKGLNIKEAWIARCKINGKTYKNVVATIANDKTLIRFQPNRYPLGRSPFVFMALHPDGDCLYGYGLNSKGLPILDAANEIFNGRLDEIKIKMHPPVKYWDDAVFNPYNVLAIPGALIKVSGPESMATNLQPLIQDLSALSLTYTEVAELKAEFESVTVPKVVKGMIDTKVVGTTATEITQAQNNSAGRMHIDAFNINIWLKSLLELVYSFLHQKITSDPMVQLECARVTQESTELREDPATGAAITHELTDEELISKLPVPLPLPEVDIDLVAYQNYLRKKEQLESMAMVLPMLAQSPAGRHLDFDRVAEEALRLNELPDDLLMDEDQRAQVDNQEAQAAQQQQQMAIQEIQLKYEIENKKVELQHQIEMEKLALEREKLQLEYAFKANESERQQQNTEIDREVQREQSSPE